MNAIPSQSLFGHSASEVLEAGALLWLNSWLMSMVNQLGSIRIIRPSVEQVPLGWFAH